METCPASEPARPPAKAWPKASSSMWPWGTWPRPSTALQSQPWSRACCSPALYPATSAARDWLKSGPFGLAKEKSNYQKCGLRWGAGRLTGSGKTVGIAHWWYRACSFQRAWAVSASETNGCATRTMCRTDQPGSSNNSNSTSKNYFDRKRRYKRIININK